MNKSVLREELSNYAHEAWAGWMKYLFDKSANNSDGSVTIPAELVRRWKRQVSTPYSDLSETEKDSDRMEADSILKIVFGKPDRSADWQKASPIGETDED